MSDDGGVGRWGEWSQEAECWKMETISSIITTHLYTYCALYNNNNKKKNYLRHFGINLKVLSSFYE